jgi:hypothetical protein
MLMLSRAEFGFVVHMLSFAPYFPRVKLVTV